MRTSFVVLSFALSVSHAIAAPLLPVLQETELALHTPPAGLVKRSKRVQVLRDSGLEPDIARMDELDRDLLVLAAISKSSDALAAKYPTLAPAKLKKMQELLLERR